MGVQPNFGAVIVVALLLIGVLFVIFLVLRELMCWYWKINKLVDIQNEMNGHLKTIANLLSKNSAGDTQGLKSIPDSIDPHEKYKPKLEETPEKLMEKYGITFSKTSGKYVFQSYSYDELKDAIAYAKQREPQMAN